jgi:hypothetical protein
MPVHQSPISMRPLERRLENAPCPARPGSCYMRVPAKTRQLTRRGRRISPRRVQRALHRSEPFRRCLRGERVPEGAARCVAGPVLGELRVEGAEFAHAGRAGVAGDGEGLHAEAGCPCRVGLGGAGDGDGKLGGEVAAVAGEGAAGRGDRVFQDGDGDIGASGGLVAGRGLLGEGAQVVVVQVNGCVLAGDVRVLA